MKCNVFNKKEPTSDQRKALKQQVGVEFNKMLDGFIRNINVQIYYYLHFKLGFGEKRLKTFALEFNKQLNELKNYYEMQDEDVSFLCEMQLKNDGIDVEELLNE